MNKKPIRSGQREKLTQKQIERILRLHAEGMPQRKIAKEVNASQSSVSRRTSKANKDGRLSEKKRKWSFEKTLNEKLCDLFGLNDVKILHKRGAKTLTGNTLCEALGKLAAPYIDEIVRSEMLISVSHGRSVFYTGAYLSIARFEVRVIPMMLIRGLDFEKGKIPSWVNAINIASKYWMDQTWDQFIPPKFEGVKSRDKILSYAREMHERDAVKDALEDISDSNIVMMGAGPLYNETTFARVARSIGIEYSELERLKIVGSICHTPFDVNGNPVTDLGLHELAITMPLDKLQNLSKDKNRFVILIAGGFDKKEIIYIAADKGFCNVLITDEQVAEWLVKKKEREKKT